MHRLAECWPDAQTRELLMELAASDDVDCAKDAVSALGNYIPSNDGVRQWLVELVEQDDQRAAPAVLWLSHYRRDDDMRARVLRIALSDAEGS